MGGYVRFPRMQVDVKGYMPNAISPNVIGGNPQNAVSAGVRGATIAYGAAERRAVYDQLYGIYRELHDAFGAVPGARGDLGTVMKRLLTIKERAVA